MKQHFWLVATMWLATALSLVSCLDQGQPGETRTSNVGTLPRHSAPSATAWDIDNKMGEPVLDSQGQPAFPQHSEPLATDWGRQYMMGELVLNGSCLRIQGNDELRGRADFVPSFLPIWPEGFTSTRVEDSVAIVDGSGQNVAKVGDYVRLSGDRVGSDSLQERQIAESIPADCKGPYYLVGDDVTVIEADEREIVPVADSDIYFRRQKTEEVGFTLLPDTADGYGPVSEPLVLEDNCILVAYPDGEKYVPVWPAGFTPHLEDGLLEVRNGGGRTIARIGERLRIRGSIVQEYIGGVVVPECGARLLRVKQIINADLPLEFLHHGDRWKREADQAEDTIRGYIDVTNGCMHINYNFLLWPSGYRLEKEGSFFRVLNESGMVVAERDEEATLQGHRIKSDDKFGPEIIRMMPIDCPPRSYWIVTGHE